MRTWRHNGERWHESTEPTWRRVLRWLVWLGGWESTRQLPLRLRLKNVTPVSLLGHRVTWYGWGGQIRTPEGWLVWERRSGQVFVSKDGTPSGAHLWLRNPPREVLEQSSWRYS